MRVLCPPRFILIASVHHGIKKLCGVSAKNHYVFCVAKFNAPCIVEQEEQQQLQHSES